MPERKIRVFSQLGPLFKTTLRQAEQADTRLQIRREEKDNPGKRQDSEEQAEETGGLWEDSTEVSVGALRTFLIEFLKGRGETGPETTSGKQENMSIANPLPMESPPPAATAAARAARAYSTVQTQSYGPPPVPAAPSPEPAAEEVDLVSLLEADELRTIHVLIGELDQLAGKGVQTLVIEKADSFLQALVAAVRLAKQVV
jgi:hypothetical protein